jgi:hypothetical protein
VRRVGELDVRRAVPDAVDAQARQRDEELLRAAGGQLDGQHRVPELLDHDAAR